MKTQDESVLDQLKAEGVRVYGKVIISPFSTRDTGRKMQLVNLLIEKAGYTLSDGRGFVIPIAPVATP
jgi:hypothetical protein